MVELYPVEQLLLGIFNQFITEKGGSPKKYQQRDPDIYA